jgi:4-diphosphocytidyl-2-C-methyl-D-erythritol kinase
MSVRAHAKINRSLFVLGVRADGYHELKTVFQSLALHDTLHFEAADRLSLACSTSGIPLDERNLVWKAAQLVWAAAGRDGEPAGRARIVKRIPAQGGLGGGSADGAAALVGWNRLWATGLSPSDLAALAVRLGADVPFFLCGGTVLGLSRGDELYPLVDLPSRWVVLVSPSFGVSTPDAFRWWDEDRAARCEPRAGWTCVNDLEPPVSRRHPEVTEIRDGLTRLGAEAAVMTGSGSTVFGLFTSEEVARAASTELAARGRWQTMLTRTATRRRARIEP